MLRAGGSLAFILGTLLCVPVSAWGETPVESRFELAEGLRLEGNTRWSTQWATVDLVPALLSGEVPAVPLDGARGWRVDSTELGNVEFRRQSTQNASLELGSGTLVLERCWRPCVAIAVADGDAVASFEGRAAGRLAWNVEPRAYWAIANKSDGVDGSNFFHHAIPPGTLGVAGSAAPDSLRVAEGRATLEGRFRILLHNVTAHWEGIQRADVDTRPARKPLDGIGLVEEWKQSFVWLEAEGVIDLPGGTRTAMYAEAPQIALDGRLVAPTVAGELRHGRNRTSLDGSRIDATGHFGISPWVEEERLVGLAPSEQFLHADIKGDATLLYAGDIRVHDPARAAAAATVPLAIVIASLLLLLLRPALLTPLYSRLARERILDSPKRQAVLSLLRAKPGLTAEALAREMGLVRTTVAHHVAILQAHALVVGHRSGRLTRLYPAQLSPPSADAPAQLLLADPTRRDVARAVLVTKHATPRDVARTTEISRRLAAYHLAKLREAGLVEARGWPHRFSPTPRLEGLLVERHEITDR